MQLQLYSLRTSGLQKTANVIFFDDLAEYVNVNLEPLFHVDKRAVGHGFCLFKKCLDSHFGLEFREKYASTKSGAFIAPFLGEKGKNRGFVASKTGIITN